MRDYREFLSEVLVTEDQLQKRIAELGVEISADYANKKLLLVCILKGGVVFMVDLMKHITIPHSIEFMVVSTYGTGSRESTGRAKILLDIDVDISDYHVILVEDIIDSGYTIKSVLEMLTTRKPASLEVCVLLDKIERREVDVHIRYRGFVIPNKFVFGYGLDMDEYYRNLPFVGVVDLNHYGK